MTIFRLISITQRRNREKQPCSAKRRDVKIHPIQRSVPFLTLRTTYFNPKYAQPLEYPIIISLCVCVCTKSNPVCLSIGRNMNFPFPCYTDNMDR